MSLIDVKNLTFSYDGSFDNVFENVSFQIDTDWKIGFTGRNGRGKTTFLKLLMGSYEYTGTINSSVNFEYFPFEVENTALNGIEIAESLYSDFMLWELEYELNKLETDSEILYRPFSTLSKGEQTKLMLAVLFIKENSFLLIDEPTNHLDLKGRESVSRYLKGKKGFILVSHDRKFLDGCVDHILSINRSDIEIFKGNFSSWYEYKEKRDLKELAENDRLKKQIKSFSESAAEKSAWSNKVENTKYGTKNSGLRPDRGFIGHKAAKMAKRSKAVKRNMENAIEEKSKLLKNIEKSEDLKIEQLEYHSKNLLTLKDVSLYYGDTKVCGNITFNVEKGDRVAVLGKNGSGKSSLLKLIAFGNISYKGTFIKGSQLKISYVSQDTSFLRGNLKNFAFENNIDESLFMAILRKLDFSREQFNKNLESFSQGQKKKVLIAKSLCEKAHFLVWDEPLNYIDVISRIQIENLLLNFKPTIIFVEHDKEFYDSISTKQVFI